MLVNPSCRETARTNWEQEKIRIQRVTKNSNPAPISLFFLGTRFYFCWSINCTLVSVRRTVIIPSTILPWYYCTCNTHHLVEAFMTITLLATVYMFFPQATVCYIYNRLFYTHNRSSLPAEFKKTNYLSIILSKLDSLLTYITN